MMFEKFICLLLGHKWRFFPVNISLWDYKVCDRCSKSIATSPYITAGEIEYIDHVFVDALSADLIARSLFMKKGEEND